MFLGVFFFNGMLVICIIPGYKLTDSSDRLLHLSATHLTRTMSMAPKERNNDHNDSEDTKKKRGRHF